DALPRFPMFSMFQHSTRSVRPRASSHSALLCRTRRRFRAESGNRKHSILPQTSRPPMGRGVHTASCHADVRKVASEFHIAELFFILGVFSAPRLCMH